MKAAFKTAGFRVVANKASNNYNALWSGRLKPEDFKKLNRYSYDFPPPSQPDCKIPST